MNDNTSIQRRKMNYVAACLALMLLLWANLLVPVAAKNGPEPIATTLYLPFALGMPVWQPVGEVPTAVNATLFYDVAVCGKYALAGTNIGLLSLVIQQPKPTWQQETGFGSGTDQIVSGVVFADVGCETAYAASRTQGVWYGSRTANKWTWTRIDQTLNEAYVVLVNNQTLYTAGNFGIAQASPLPVPPNAAQWKATNIVTPTYSLSVSVKNPSVIYAAVWNRGVFEPSLTDSLQWNQIGTIPHPLVYDAAANETGVIVAGTDRGLLRWRPSAWATTADQFANTNFTVLPVGTSFYAGQTGHGILYSLDDGQTWSQMNAGLPVNEQFRVRRLRLNMEKDELYAATSSGVWVWKGMP